MMNLIAVEGINIYAYHGCLAEEGLIGGNYIVDVYMQTDFTEAAKTDDLNKTIDYCAVYEIAEKEMAIRAKLIEEVAMRIHKAILKDFTAVQKARVRVTKLKPPMNGNVDKVYVEIE
jgi:dihydroneopterin aldolase